MSPDKLFNVKKDPAAARLAANNKKVKKNPSKTGVAIRGYDGEKG
jgi:hypothetical protein